MARYFLILFFIFLMISAETLSQEPVQGFSYQMTSIANPGVTGSEGDGYMRLSYVNYYPGNSYNLHSLHLSYDSYFTALHGGAGFYISDNYMGGIVNDVRGGISYSYIFRAGRDFFVGAGLSASVFHRGFDLKSAVLPDQIDPLGGNILPSGEALGLRGRTILDIGTGFLFMSGRFYGGFAVNHLAKPVISETDVVREKLDRYLLIHAAVDLYPGTDRRLRITPVSSIEAGGGLFSAGAGAAAEYNHISADILFLGDNNKNMDIQAGFSVSTGNILFIYNYRFNIVSENKLLPMAILHHAGIVFRLNNVDKRKAIKTINFPKL